MVNMAAENNIIASIEWQDFQRPWKIDTLAEPESLPPGAEAVEVWREEDYKVKAKITGTIADSTDRLHPETRSGTSLPQFVLRGSGAHGILDYEVGPGAIGNLVTVDWKDQEANPPTVDYEMEFLTSRARWSNRYRDPSETKWFTEWYLNGPREPFIYPRGGVARVTERYERERKLGDEESDSFEHTNTIGGVSFAFIETADLCFVVQQVPGSYGPSWSECLSIEYRG